MKCHEEMFLKGSKNPCVHPKLPGLFGLLGINYTHIHEFKNFVNFESAYKSMFYYDIYEKNMSTDFLKKWFF